MLGSSIVIGLLLQDAATSTATSNRIYPGKAPQSTAGPVTPYITVRQISGSYAIAFEGVEGTASPSFEILCHDVSTQLADTLAGYARNRLNGFKGTFYPAGQSSPITIKGIFLDDEAESWLPSVHSEEVGMSVARVVVKVWFQ